MRGEGQVCRCRNGGSTCLSWGSVRRLVAFSRSRLDLLVEYSTSMPFAYACRHAKSHPMIPRGAGGPGFFGGRPSRCPSVE
jgi:hypothetical protein